jgi:ketosteroid isomerase-like protein
LAGCQDEKSVILFFSLTSVRQYIYKMKTTIFLLLIVTTTCARGQTKDEAQIRQLLKTQTQSWNRGDIEGFMQGYWKSDSLLFIGKSGVNHGWQTTLNNYKKGYPDTAAMGKLSFDILLVKKLSAEYYYVVGKWMLARSIGDVSGHYDLLFRKIKGRWYIIADHSS